MSRRGAKKRIGGPRGAGEIYVVGPPTFADIAQEGPIQLFADVSETRTGIVIRLELPGVPAESIDVTVRGSTIEVSGEKAPDAAGADASYMCLERAFGRFSRSFELSGSLNMSGVTAALRGGVLTVFVPKQEERRGRALRIPVAIEP